MLPFYSKMHQNRWRLGLRPRPRWESLKRSTDPLAVMGWDRDLMTPSLGSANTPPPWTKILDKCLLRPRYSGVCMKHVIYDYWQTIIPNVAH